MKPVEKPRISYIAKPFFFGVPGIPFWMCSDDVGVGVGSTPKSAYEDWLLDRPKTYTVYWIRKALVSILG